MHYLYISLLKPRHSHFSSFKYLILNTMRRIFTLLILLTLILTKTSESQIPELLYYKFDIAGTSVQNHALTPVGANPASITGTGLSIGSTGLSGTALVGTGVTSTGGVINTGWSTNLSGSFTIAWWTSNITPSSTLWYIWGDAGATSLRCFTNGAAGANNWMCRGGGLPDLTITGGATTASNMMHAVYDATTQQYRGYLNGTLISTVSVTTTIAMAGTGFQIGGYSSNSNLNGKMDEFRIYNRALTQAEITATWNQSLNSVTDASLIKFQALQDTICSGNTPVVVLLKNFGPQTITSVKIPWTVNNVLQTTFNWSGNLAVADSVYVTLGNYQFNSGNTYNLVAYTYLPNNTADTLNNLNDTVKKNIVLVNPSPTAIPADTLLTQCPGDSVYIHGTLAGSPPWNLVISNGTTNFNFPNLTSAVYGQYFSPASNTTYSIVSVSDATGCINTTPSATQVVLLLAPPAVITPIGPTDKCFGDSVALMATVGLNFTYQWKKDGTDIQGATNYTYSANTNGNYTVKVTTPAGCSSTSNPTPVTIHPLPVVNLGSDTALMLNKNITLNAGNGFATYLWSTGASTQQVTLDTSKIGAGVSLVWVEVSDNFGCIGRDTIQINYTNNIGLDPNNKESALRIIPNPSDGQIQLILPENVKKGVTVEVFGIDGKCVYAEEIIIHGTQGQHMDLRHLQNGEYLIRMKMDGMVSISKLIILK
jgi:hypothetical protein